MGAHLVRTSAEFNAVVGVAGDPRREELRTQLQLDFAFIAAYWLAFASMSGLLAGRDFSAAVWLGTVAGECATVAALLDVTENVQTLRLLHEPSQSESDRGAIVVTMRRASLAKWLFAFTTTGILSTLFLERGGWHVLIGAVYALAAIAGIATAIAAFTAKDAAHRSRLIVVGLRWSFLLMVCALTVGLPFAAALT